MDDFIKSKVTYNTALGIYAMTPLTMLPTLLKMDAPYGKFAGKFIIDCSYSGKWSWFIMEVVSPLTFITTILTIRKHLNPYQLVLTSCWMLHYFHRSILYPLRAHSMAPIHILASSSAVIFNLLNAYTNAFCVANNHYESISAVGLILWVIGLGSNIYHDSILFKLRKMTAPGNYSIPYGGLFEYISCPNYFSEAVEWTGFAIAAHPSLPAWVFVAATVSNLFPRALSTHQWYKKRFQHYPSSRKAVLPFLL